MRARLTFMYQRPISYSLKQQYNDGPNLQLVLWYPPWRRYPVLEGSEQTQKDGLKGSPMELLRGINDDRNPRAKCSIRNVFLMITPSSDWTRLTLDVAA